MVLKPGGPTDAEPHLNRNVSNRVEGLLSLLLRGERVYKIGVTGQDLNKIREMERRQDKMRTRYGSLTQRRTPSKDVNKDYLKVSSD
ncbi:Bgt-20332 [Blumeria graminis f. sp. tritici]|uniref:Bgt-20332 n=2 Tax=Blumeria graminis f. sp. tritici TaxID=62690 RepID=A0A9X9MI40_BLUGR|nr:Bgt-20332 [Blumeria graminis f. sp. tritici]